MMSTIPHEPIVIGHRMTRLVSSEFESHVRKANLINDDQVWSEHARENGMCIDLSRVTWVDPHAALQLVLFIDHAMRNKIKATVVLPFPSILTSERDFIHRADQPDPEGKIIKQIERRSKSLKFLENLGLKKAISDARDRYLKSEVPIAEPEVLENIDLGVVHLNGAVRHEQPEPPSEPDGDGQNDQDGPRYRWFLPLTWISFEDLENEPRRSRLANRLRRHLGDSEKGIPSIESQTIVDVLLQEITENVDTHARTTQAMLFTYIAKDGNSDTVDHTSGHRIRIKDYHVSEQSFYENLARLSGPFLEMSFGDSGVGVDTTLRDAFRDHQRGDSSLLSPGETTAWAFQRWSTSLTNSRRRGVRGLFRVNEIVRRHSGLITLQSNRVLVGYDHTDRMHSEQFISTQRHAMLPGTTVKMVLLPHTKPAEIHATSPLGSQIPSELGVMRYEFYRVSASSKMLLSDASKKIIEEKLQSWPTDSRVALVVIFDIESGSQSQHTQYDKEAIENALRFLSERSRPHLTIVFGLPGGWSAIETAAISINTGDAPADWDDDTDSGVTEKDSFPILVVGFQGASEQFVWVGGPPEARESLKGLWEAAPQPIAPPAMGSTDVDEMSDFADFVDQTGQGQYFMCASSLSLGDACKSLLREAIDTADDIHSAGVPVLKGVFLTPTLDVINRWVNFDLLFDKLLSGRVISTHYLAVALWQSVANVSDYQALDAIVVDSTCVPKLADALRQTLHPSQGVKRISGSPSSPIPRGFQIVERNKRTLIYADIISSGSAVTRYTAQVLRDGGRVHAIACIVDAREHPEEMLEVFGQKFPVISLVQYNIHLSMDRLGEAIPIDPVKMKPVQPVPADGPDAYAFMEDDWQRIAIQHKPFYFGHIVGPTGHHFTFYFDVRTILDDDSIIDTIKQKIDNWILWADSKKQGTSPSDDESGSDQIEIWYPATANAGPDAARLLAEAVQAKFPEPKPKIVGRRRESSFEHYKMEPDLSQQAGAQNVLILDWGSVKGGSVMSMIRQAANNGAKSIFACILVSQLPYDDEQFLSNVRTIQRTSVAINQSPTATDSGQIHLLPLVHPIKPAAQAPASPTEGIPTDLADIKVEFLSRLPIEAFLPSECPVCQRLERMSSSTPKNETLRAYAETQRTYVLRQRNRDDVLLDLDNGPDWHLVNGDRSWRLLKWRTTLITAKTSTPERMQLYQSLDQLRAYDGNEGNSSKQQREDCLALTHLLSTESQWLRIPPLNLTKFRTLLAQIALSIALGGDYDDADRSRAITLLRMASKAQFVGALASVYTSSSHNMWLQQQILLDVYSILDRSYLGNRQYMDPILEQLKIILDSSSAIDYLPPSDRLSELVSINDIAGSTKTRNEVRDTSLVEVWIQLTREDLGIFLTHHSPITRARHKVALPKLSKSQSRGEYVPSEQEYRWAHRLPTHWRTIKSFLMNRVVPKLEVLMPILMWDEKNQEVFDLKDREFLLSLIDNTDQHPLSEESLSSFFSIVDSQVKDFSSDASILGDHDRRSAYENQMNRLSSVILRRAIIDHNNPNEPHLLPDSKLREYLSSCPTDIRNAISDVWQEVRDSLNVRVYLENTIKSPTYVFCTKTFVEHALETVFENLDRVDDQDQPVYAKISAVRDNGKICITISNTNTIRNQHNNQTGLINVRERLTLFEASIDEVQPPTGSYNSNGTIIPYSFEVSLEFHEIPE